VVAGPKASSDLWDRHSRGPFEKRFDLTLEIRLLRVPRPDLGEAVGVDLFEYTCRGAFGDGLDQLARLEQFSDRHAAVRSFQPIPAGNHSLVRW
jgi:hypothetical protein